MSTFSLDQRYRPMDASNSSSSPSSQLSVHQPSLLAFSTEQYLVRNYTRLYRSIDRWVCHRGYWGYIFLNIQSFPGSSFPNLSWTLLPSSSSRARFVFRPFLVFSEASMPAFLQSQLIKPALVSLTYSSWFRLSFVKRCEPFSARPPVW